MSQELKFNQESGITEKITSFTIDGDYPFFIDMCGVEEYAPSSRSQRNVSNFYIIGYITKGSGFAQENDRICHAASGDSFIFHSGANQIFYTDKDEVCVKKHVVCHGPLADSLFEIYKLNSSLYYPRLNLESQIDEIIKICQSNLSLPEIMARGSILVMDMIQKLYTYNKVETREETTIATADQLKLLIDELWNSDINLTELAQKVYCSRNHAIRLFKERFGISPYKYISKIRLENSKKMLSESHLPIGEVSKSLGFCDSRYFSNWFKKQTGISPMEYRAENENDCFTKSDKKKI